MAMTLRLPPELDDRLRAQAYLERRPMSELVAEAVERDLPRLEAQNGHLRQEVGNGQAQDRQGG